jgi:hypothetical protein
LRRAEPKAVAIGEKVLSAETFSDDLSRDPFDV